jgi:hypothetical protein
MVKRYSGGIISSTEIVPSPDAASAFYSLSEHRYAKYGGTWPTTTLPQVTSVEYLVVA